MVSFWPWKGDDNSASSFEKTLSTLSTKIAQATARLDQQRQSSRRIKALWTLYSTFAYLFYSIVLALILGWESWGVKEYAAIVGGPVLIYGVRTLSSRIFDYRISRIQRRLDDFHKQREETIEKLKVATKYNSTQQLLEKYGGESPKPSPAKGQDGERQPAQQQQHVARTGLPPPPTANIRRPPSAPQTQNDPPFPSSPSPPLELPQAPQTPPQPSFPTSFSPQTPTDQPGFAPNAFTQNGQYIEQPHWYDRLLDVLLGEDETQPRNRMVMICTACRLVNGQAPPGSKPRKSWAAGGAVAVELGMVWKARQQRSSAVCVKMLCQSSESMEEGVIVASSEEDQTEEEPKPAPVRRSKRGAKGNKAEE
ncbi:hypothetical protein N7445_000732 [Penicillium cf. griseofulvum]|nr:hypothetical protein N7445_000732 [Penicillium cf. griseofulvum]